MNRFARFASALALAAGIAMPATAQPAAQPTAEQSRTHTIDINRASASELAELPGIGPSRADAIVAFRDRRPFRRPEDLLRVRGIGRSTFRALRDRISVSESSRPRRSATGPRRSARRASAQP